MQTLEYFHRVDPKVTYAAAFRVYQSKLASLSQMRPKAQREAQLVLAMMRRDLDKLSSTCN